MKWKYVSDRIIDVEGKKTSIKVLWLERVDIMNTFRHDYTLIWGCYDMTKHIMAPRYFICNNNMYFVHIMKDCEYVVIYDKLRYVNNTCIRVALGNTLKLYANKKGLYFNYSYWINNYDKKTIRVYICE